MSSLRVPFLDDLKGTAKGKHLTAVAPGCVFGHQRSRGRIGDAVEEGHALE